MENEQRKDDLRARPASVQGAMRWVAWAASVSLPMSTYLLAVALNVPFDVVAPAALAICILGTLVSSTLVSSDRSWWIWAIKCCGMVALSVLCLGAEFLLIGFVDLFVHGLEGIQ